MSMTMAILMTDFSWSGLARSHDVCDDVDVGSMMMVLGWR